MQDLSQHHEMIMSLFDSSVDSSTELSADALHQFEEDGFVIGRRPVLNDAQLTALKTELDELTIPDHEGRELWYEYNSNESAEPDKVLFHALGAWRLRPAFHDVVWHSNVTVPARQLLGGAVRFWHDQLFCKPAQHGGVVAWHQDFSYWTLSLIHI